MRKGNKVAVRAGVELWRPVTAKERADWYEAKAKATEEARERGEDTFHINFDCAGESRFAPRTAYRRETAGEWTVVRARCASERGYYAVSGCCLLRHTDGTEWYTYRKNVAVVSEGTGPKVKAPKARVGTDADIEAWVAKVNAKFGGARSINWGRKYAKVVRGGGGGGGVYCFVDRKTGDVLKAASWSAPAKHARGNIYAADPLAGVGKHGAAYLA